jgi:solute carrier family 25 phosphate transporter 23/24/25/41
LTTFEYTKRWAIRVKERRGRESKEATLGTVATAAIGGFSGAFGASVVWPLNMLRTRLQTQGTVLHPPTYTGIVDVTRKTIQNEGVRGLFRGITPNLIKVIPAVSVTYVVYDKLKQRFGLE